MPEKSRVAQRHWGLDLLRALAIGSVLHLHAAFYVSELIPGEVYRWLWPVADGVSLFFVLSGFLVGRLLIGHLERGGGLFRFWVERWRRTLPLYFIVLLGLVVWLRPTAETWLPFAAFVQNLAWPQTPHFFAEAWSLAVEEWFYLLVPAAAIFLNRRWGAGAARNVLNVAVCAILGALAYRWVQVLSWETVSFEIWDAEIRKVVVARLDALGVGLIAAVCARSGSALSLRSRCGLFAVGCLILGYVLAMNPIWVGLDSPGHAVTLPLVEALGYACLLPVCLKLECTVVGFKRAVEWTARASYAIYLVNLTVAFTLLFRLGLTADATHPILGGLIYIATVVTLGGLLYHFVDRPLETLRRRAQKSLGDKTEA